MIETAFEPGDTVIPDGTENMFEVVFSIVLVHVQHQL